MSVNLSGLANAVGTATSLLTVTPLTNVGIQPMSGVNINGTLQAVDKKILFHYEGENSATIETDITDHYVEDNTALQDHIALKPVTITTQGFVGELNDVVPEAIQLLRTAADKLYALSAYTPALSITALNTYNTALYAYNVAANAVQGIATTLNTFGVGGLTGPDALIDTRTQQEKYFDLFYKYFLNRTIFKVQTPWRVFENMVIKSMRAVQDPSTRMVSDFEVSFRELRFASTKTISLALRGGRSSNMAGSPQDNGKVSLSNPVAQVLS